MPIGALFGAPVAGWLADSIGRKSALMVNSLPLAIGWLLIILSTATTGVMFRPLLFAGRFVTGFGAGFASLAAPVGYIVYLARINMMIGVYEYTNSYLVLKAGIQGHIRNDNSRW